LTQNLKFVYQQNRDTWFEDHGTILFLKFGVSHRKYCEIEAWNHDTI